MTTTVVNKKTDKFDVYIGRGSKWGNPFRIGIDGDRDEVIELYEDWLKGQVATPPGFKIPSLSEALVELKGKRLGCFCKPLACHGDVLAKIVDLK